MREATGDGTLAATVMVLPPTDTVIPAPAAMVTPPVKEFSVETTVGKLTLKLIFDPDAVMVIEPSVLVLFNAPVRLFKDRTGFADAVAAIVIVPAGPVVRVMPEPWANVIG